MFQQLDKSWPHAPQRVSWLGPSQLMAQDAAPMHL
jgi:hypothetical protein